MIVLLTYRLVTWTITVIGWCISVIRWCNEVNTQHLVAVAIGLICHNQLLESVCDRMTKTFMWLGWLLSMHSFQEKSTGAWRKSVKGWSHLKISGRRQVLSVLTLLDFSYPPVCDSLLLDFQKSESHCELILLFSNCGVDTPFFPTFGVDRLHNFTHLFSVFCWIPWWLLECL